MTQGSTRDDVGIQIDLSTNKSSPVDADKIGIWDTVGLKLAHTTFLQFKSYLSSSLMGRQHLTFAEYANASWNQSLDNSYPFICTIDTTYTFVKWSQALNVGGTNNGSHYWTFSLYDILGNLINQINTSAISGSNTWTLLTDTTWSVSSVGTSNIAIFILATKTGSPGNYTLACPAIEVSA